jgi:hypothetical protein
MLISELVVGSQGFTPSEALTFLCLCDNSYFRVC